MQCAIGAHSCAPLQRNIFSTYNNTSAAPNTTNRTIEFVVDDGQAFSNTSAVATTTLAFNLNQPPVAVNDAVTTDEDTIFNGNVLIANPTTPDSDPNNDTLTVTQVNGNATSVGNQITLTSGALLTLNSDGTFAYNPNAQADGKGGTSTATVNITINGVIDVPVLTTIQAESLTNVTGYRIENNSFAEGGSMLSLVGGSTTEVGTATFSFNGPSGLYHLIIGTFDENDGQSTFNLTQQGNLVGSIVLNQDLNGNSPSTTTKVERLLGGELTVTTGDSFTITGIENVDEYARLDFIRFVPVDAVTTAPGGNGADNIIGGTGNDTINAGNGNDNVYGGAGADNIIGGNGNDTLDGGTGNDTLTGNNGNDFLRGGFGNDILTGGNGSDTFVLAVGEGTDTITDFKKGGDLIGLYSGLSFGQLSFSGSNILVTSTNEILATLTGINTTTLTQNDFISV